MDEDIEDELIFWNVFQKYPQILMMEDKLSFPKLQKIYAIISMNEDYSRAIDAYEFEQLKKKNKGK